jgi:hypothetical protein
LIINLPGQPKAIKETLDGVSGDPHCIDLIAPVHRDERRRLQRRSAEERDAPTGMTRFPRARNDA